MSTSLSPLPRKTWDLRSGRKPEARWPGLSGVVAVTYNGGRNYAYIRFEKPFYTWLAKKMPKGVGMAHPVFLHVIQFANTWKVFARYLKDSGRVLLFEVEGQPSWVKLQEKP